MQPERRSTRFWLDALERRRPRMASHPIYGAGEIHFANERERNAAIRFFNAALRAEESGFQKAHELADQFREADPDLARVLELYGKEEGWHHELLMDFLPRIGGAVRPMGRVTRAFYSLYGRARAMDTILLTNLMFETIGATTYRLALRTVEEPATRSMLQTLTKDEAFHVPLNVHFLREALKAEGRASFRLQVIFRFLYGSLLLLPWASRPKAEAFDRIDALTLSRAYSDALRRVFESEPELGLRPPGWMNSVLNWMRPGRPIRGKIADEASRVASLEGALEPEEEAII
jgi:hypothetical protein